jgi:hypothetical protein
MVQSHEIHSKAGFALTICILKLHTNNLIRSAEDFLRKRVAEETKTLIAYLNKWCRSKRALAIPATFMILFVSMLGVVSITYYFAVEKVNTRSTTLKIVTAKQDMLSFDETLLSTLWQPGSARTFEFSDSGGQVNVQPSAGSLLINITDNGDISATVFNEMIGQVIYELPYSESPETGLFLKGDSRTIINQSGSVITQLYIRSGAQHPEILLRYRPTISYTTAGVENDKAVTSLRIYVVNLNSSEAISMFGTVPLKMSCVSTQITTTTYDLSYEPETLLVTSILDGAVGQVSIPVSSAASGAIINVEMVLCNVTIERWVR